MSIYRQGEFLGKGGFGEVYKATYGPDELVIKILKSSKVSRITPLNSIDKTDSIKRELHVYSLIKNNPFTLNILDMV
jgi:serine/threonine protein kinase